MDNPLPAQILQDIRDIAARMVTYSEAAQFERFLSFFENAAGFVHISSDGKMRNYEEFKDICREYYGALKSQTVLTRRQEFNVVDTDLVISAWTGNIVAHFKNGTAMIMNNYSISNVFRKMAGEWKIIHSYESAVPPEITGV